MMNRSLMCHFMFTALAVLAGSVHAQIPDGWEIVTITDDPEIFDNAPDINDRGQIVFSRQLDLLDLASNEIFLYDRGNLIQIPDDDIRDVFPRINNLGDIVWSRDIHENGLLAIVRWKNGQLEVVSDQAYTEGGVDINDAEQMVWHATPSEPPNDSDIFFFDGSDTVRITNDSFANAGERINELGQFVWIRFDFSVSPWESEIMLYDNGSIRQPSSGQGQIQAPDLNDMLEIVWESPQAGVELWRSGTTVQIAPDGSRTSISNNGTVAFTRWDSVGRNWNLWTFNNGKLSQLTTSSFGGIPWEINSRGEIAFQWGRLPWGNIATTTSASFLADGDSDGDVDLADAAILQNCWAETVGFTSECANVDASGNGVVGLDDAAALAELLTGPNLGP